MSQTGYLVLAFAAMVVTLLAWAGILLAKFARLAREAAERDTDG
ncbi:MAG: hypothetical protein ACKVUT_04450 [Gaiella sp.]